MGEPVAFFFRGQQPDDQILARSPAPFVDNGIKVLVDLLGQRP